MAKVTFERTNITNAGVGTELSEFAIAVLVPCYNEEQTIQRVVSDFQTYLPGAGVYVYDNNSSDATSKVAERAGAIVRIERTQGKGNVVRRMFADIEADVFVLVDGDATYDASRAPEMITMLLNDSLDMVTGKRVSEDIGAYRPGHRFGNKLLTNMVSAMFGKPVGDMLSGYRVLSRRYVKSFPAMSRGFETETELTVHALELRMPIAEVETVYLSRPEGSTSKLSTYKDGVRIVRMIGRLVKEERPFPFFGLISLVLLAIALSFGTSILLEFNQTGLVPRLPSAVLATGLVLLAFLSLSSGVVLDSVSLSRREARRFAYLSQPSPLVVSQQLTRSSCARHPAIELVS